MSSGATPPTTKTDRQPKRGIRSAASQPPTAAPTEKPDHHHGRAAPMRVEFGRHRDRVGHRAAQSKAG